MRPDPTDEQLHILDLARSTTANLMINALAGTGKTTTLEMIEHAVPTKPVLYLAFNRKIADDATKRMATTTTVRTFNSLGHRIWAKATKQFKPDPKKVPDLLRAMIETESRETKRKLWECFWEIVNGVATAKAIGYIPQGHSMHKKRLADLATLEDALDEAPDGFVVQWIDRLLTISIGAAYSGSCDFNDQIYMPTLFSGTFPEFPLVLVDEYQDLNPVNHEMIRKLTKHRLIGVGDPFQSIYEFRGAESGGMARAVQTFKMTECDLSVSFRCPRRIVEHVRWRVPKFKWVKEGGLVGTNQNLTFDHSDGTTIICRNNAPLFKLAMQFLNKGLSVQVLGSDIGPRLIATLRKLGSPDLDRAELLAAIDSWLEARLTRGSKSAKDTAECMRVFASHGANLTQAIAYAEHLFAQKGKTIFTTGHKAKGLEWPTVLHLDPWLCDDTEQDRNLRYVISTRSSDRLIEINSEDIRFLPMRPTE